MSKLRQKLLRVYDSRDTNYIVQAHELGISETFFWRLGQGENFSVAVAIKILIQIGELPQDFDFAEKFEQSLEDNFPDLKVSEVARLVGLRATTMYEWRCGNNVPLFKTLKKYCDYLGIDVLDFLGENNAGEKQKVSGCTGDNL